MAQLKTTATIFEGAARLSSRAIGINPFVATASASLRRRAARRRRESALGATLCLLAGCAVRPGTGVLVPTASAGGGKQVTLLVATTRARDASNPTWFTSGRSDRLHFARYVVSIPPGHQPGGIEWPKGRPDPATSFATVEASPLTEAEFRRGATIRSRTAARGFSNAAIFVHGFNYNFQESLFRTAQLFADVEPGGAQILFAWPSEASPTGYVADKESVTFSRDALVDVIETVAGVRGVDRIALLSHSMGGWLTMEGLRQLRLEGRDGTIAKVDEIVLAAPDIDVDVFRKQLEIVGRLRAPPTVFVSRDDGALRLSGFLAGGRPRLGLADIDDPRIQAAAKTFDVRVIDISGIARSGDLGHRRYASVASIYTELGERLEACSRQPSLTGAGVFLLGNALPTKPTQVRGAATQ